MGLVFLDTETTGLDYENNDIVELTYATEKSDPKTLYFGIESVPAFVDNLIGFTARGIAGLRSTEQELNEYFLATNGQTMVAANPAFDKWFLKRAGLFHFHYRMLDIESYAMAKLNIDYVPGLKGVFDILKAHGYETTEPDHTSYSDVLALREAFLILRDKY